MYICICNCVYTCVHTCVSVCVAGYGTEVALTTHLAAPCGLPLRWQDRALVRTAVALAAALGFPGPHARRLRQPAQAVTRLQAGASGYLATSTLATGRRRAGGRKPEAGGEASRGLVCARTPSAAGRWRSPTASVSHGGGGAFPAAVRGGPGPEPALVGAAPHPTSRFSS